MASDPKRAVAQFTVDSYRGRRFTAKVAQVRNAVTHRSVAGAATLGEFRTLYYAAFEDLTSMA